jgi:hypothetical protein
METQVYAFAKIDDEGARNVVYKEIKCGKSRFGMWDQGGDLREHPYGKNNFLKRIKKGDWIVHVNSPSYGKCVVVQAIGEYDYDEGIECGWGKDFNNFIPVDIDTIIEFDRNDPNVLPSVNLSPMRRGQRILKVDDFLQSLDNIKAGAFSEDSQNLRGVVHLREKIENELLPQISELIHQMNRSKNLERFFHEIFDSMPNVVSIKNGFGWGTDHGADLIVEFQNPLVEINSTSKLIVQVKSYEGNHYDLDAISQIVEGINEYDADAGLLITTAQNTEALEDCVRKASEESGKVIDIIAGPDVARFVIRHAPELLVGRN